MRNGKWGPNSPTLLCGGDQDPTVFFSVNTGTMAAFWAPEPGGPGHRARRQRRHRPVRSRRSRLASSRARRRCSPSTSPLPAVACRRRRRHRQLVQRYHTNVAPFCALAARTFFASSKGTEAMKKLTRRPAGCARHSDRGGRSLPRPPMPTLSSPTRCARESTRFSITSPPTTCGVRSCRRAEPGCQEHSDRLLRIYAQAEFLPGRRACLWCSAGDQDHW